VCFAGKAKRLPPAKGQEALRQPAKEQIATGELRAVVTDARVERLEADGQVVGIGCLTRIGLSVVTAGRLRSSASA
jgi:hypothetical protein